MRSRGQRFSSSRAAKEKLSFGLFTKLRERKKNKEPKLSFSFSLRARDESPPETPLLTLTPHPRHRSGGEREGREKP